LFNTGDGYSPSLFNTGDGNSPPLVQYWGWKLSSPCSILGMETLLPLFNTGGGYSYPCLIQGVDTSLPLFITGGGYSPSLV